jgi:hypothetical protein
MHPDARDMERHSASPEELPPLELLVLRELTLEPGKQDGRDMLCAASGVVRRSGFAYVIGDDMLELGVFDIASDRPGERRRVLSGNLATGEEERKREKPDLEALTAVPPFKGAPYGGLLGLGSGSAERGRDRGFFWAFAADGSLDGEHRELDFHQLYDELRTRIGEINIEGACVFGDRLWLFHRANRGDAPNTVAELTLPELSRSLSGERSIEAEQLAALHAYELGEFDGVPLCFSDATQLFDELVVFTASAEEDGSGEAPEGSIRGSVVGTIDAGGNVKRLRKIDSRWKVEGVHAAVDTGVIEFVFVCDQDDDQAPSPLLTATMPLEERFEQSG